MSERMIILKISEKVKSIEDLMIRARQQLHMIPEIAYEEFKTAKYIESYFEDLNIMYESGIAGTGIVAFFKGSEPKKTICFRADMDALNVQEQNEVDYKSQHENKMHACGHDGHMAILLGLAKYLKENESDLVDNVLLLFQPAEEGPGGALPMIESGIFKKYNVTEVYGLHLFPNITEGKIGVKSGPMMSGTGEFDIKITGKGGHGAMPHEAIDSVLIASDMVSRLQSIISRGINPIQPAVITVGKLVAGEIRNVIAKSAVLEGTIRSFNDDVYNSIKEKMHSIAKALEITYGCSIDMSIRDMYPAVINDVKLTKFFIESQDLGTIEIIEPIMLAEDFSYYQKEVPGVFFFLGTKNEQKNYTFALHNGCFNFDEKVLTCGLQAYVNILVKRESLIK